MLRRSLTTFTPRRTARVQLLLRRDYNFASSAYNGCFAGQPEPDGAALRAGTLAYLEDFDPQSWYDDPVATILNGEVLMGGEEVETIDAFNGVNGKQVLATQAQLQSVRTHIKTFVPPSDDYREGIRRIEQVFLGEKAGALIGNQSVDFKKQDGVTEMEESVEANHVERNLNDLLLADERAGNVAIGRQPAFVGCVSNFSNFLDLFRKSLRNIELGVPVVVLSRSNTTQHMFRWFQMLQTLMAAEGIPLGMITYISCGIEDQRTIFRENQGSPLYFTGSRPVAAAIKEVLPKLIASTGGPNTMVATSLSDGVAAAAQMSTLIENSGQCTAMRHLVVPDCTEADITQRIWGENVPTHSSAAEALAQGQFAALLDGHPTNANSPGEGYTTHEKLPLAYRLSTTLPPDDIDEMWRQGFLDVTTTGEAAFGSDEMVEDLSAWLNQHQPICLAVNGDNSLLKKLWERSGMVVNTAGGEGDAPECLTAQARPQDGECFGEFPPRHELTKYTQFPAIVPSSTPGYNTCITDSALESAAAHCPGGLIAVCASSKTVGYAGVLAAYLADACGAHPGKASASRTSLYGLQRPPLNGKKTILRLDASVSPDDAAVYIVPFALTNARDSLEFSVAPDGSATYAALQKSGLLEGIDALTDETDIALKARVAATKPFNVITPPTLGQGDPAYPLPAHFVSNLFPVGHVKSTLPNDAAFAELLSGSEKWLKMTA